MYHREAIAEAARRLPDHTRRDVAEVVEILTEIWSHELVYCKEIVLPDIGLLSIEIQDVRAGGALKQYGRLRRVYGRFRPTRILKERIKEIRREKT